MIRILALLISIAVALVIAVWAERPPTPQPAHVGSEIFSAGRAMATVAAMTREPHPTGSAANAQVRDMLAAALREAGLAVRIERAEAFRQATKRDGAVTGATVDNIVAVLPGQRRDTPAVLVMTHYDSVPHSPGAGDDASGAASALEIARSLAAGEPPLRDVIFLFTDGEERGLLGAQAFFDADPLRGRVGAVVNLEARGSRGRALMFEVSQANRGLIELWARHAPHPTGNSMMGAIYRQMPNDTDLTVAFEHGRAGLNAAFGGGQFDYHNPTDNAANLDPGSLQHLGAHGLAMTRAMARAEALPRRGNDIGYFDLLGRTVAIYPLPLGWAVLAVAAAVIALLAWRTQARLGEILRGAAAAFVLTVGLGLLIHGAHAAQGGGLLKMRELLAEQEKLLVGYALLAFGWVVLVCRAVLCGRGWYWLAAAMAVAAALMAVGRVIDPFKAGAAFGVALLAFLAARKPTDGWSLWVGCMIVVLLLGVLTQAVMPGAAFLAWPLLLAAGVGLAIGWRADGDPTRGWGLVAVAFVGTLGMALLLPVTHQGYQSVGATMPSMLVLAALSGVLLWLPLISPWGEWRWGGAAAFAALAAGVAVLIMVGLTDGFSARHPRPGGLFHLTDVDHGRSYWASRLTVDELPKAGAVTRPDLAPLSTAAVWAVAAPRVPVSAPTFATELAGPGRVGLRVRTASPAQDFRLAVRSTQPLTDARINGRAIRLQANGWTLLRYTAAEPVDLLLSFAAMPGGAIEVRYLHVTPGLPLPAPVVQGLPTTWGGSGTTVTVGSGRYDW